MNYQYFTSESVAAGHPDKVCDQIADASLDATLIASPKSRVAIETLVTTNRIIMAGEVTCPKEIDFEKIARRVVKRLGYTDPIYNFTDEAKVSVYIHQQSPDIAMGADKDGAGDQGMMFAECLHCQVEYEFVMRVPAGRLSQAKGIYKTFPGSHFSFLQLAAKFSKERSYVRSTSSEKKHAGTSRLRK